MNESKDQKMDNFFAMFDKVVSQNLGMIDALFQEEKNPDKKSKKRKMEPDENEKEQNHPVQPKPSYKLTKEEFQLYLEQVKKIKIENDDHLDKLYLTHKFDEIEKMEEKLIIHNVSYSIKLQQAVVDRFNANQPYTKEEYATFLPFYLQDKGKEDTELEDEAFETAYKQYLADYQEYQQNQTQMATFLQQVRKVPETAPLVSDK